MNDPFNSQETAQTRHAYRSVTAKLGLLGLDTAIPERVRNLADKTVGKTREIFDHSVSAFEASVATFERSFDVAGQGAAAFHLKIVDVARRNVETRFDLAESLAGAKDLTDMVKLQAVNWRKQIDTLTAQADEVRTLSTKVTADSAESIKPQKAMWTGGGTESFYYRHSHSRERGREASFAAKVPEAGGNG